MPIKDKNEKALVGQIDYLQKKEMKTEEECLKLERLMADKRQKDQDRAEEKRRKKQEKKNNKKKKRKQKSSSSSSSMSPSRSEPHSGKMDTLEQAQLGAVVAASAIETMGKPSATSATPATQVLALATQSPSTELALAIPTPSNHQVENPTTNEGNTILAAATQKVAQVRHKVESLKSALTQATAEEQKLGQQKAIKRQMAAALKNQNLKRKAEVEANALEQQEKAAKEKKDDYFKRHKGAKAELEAAENDEKVVVTAAGELAAISTEHNPIQVD